MMTGYWTTGQRQLIVSTVASYATIIWYEGIGYIFMSDYCLLEYTSTDTSQKKFSCFFSYSVPSKNVT